MSKFPFFIFTFIGILSAIEAKNRKHQIIGRKPSSAAANSLSEKPNGASNSKLRRDSSKGSLSSKGKKKSGRSRSSSSSEKKKSAKHRSNSKGKRPQKPLTLRDIEKTNAGQSIAKKISAKNARYIFIAALLTTILTFLVIVLDALRQLKAPKSAPAKGETYKDIETNREKESAKKPTANGQSNSANENDPKKTTVNMNILIQDNSADEQGEDKAEGSDNEKKTESEPQTVVPTAKETKKPTKETENAEELVFVPSIKYVNDYTDLSKLQTIEEKAKTAFLNR